MIRIMLPAYNEEAAIEKLVSKISAVLSVRYKYEVLIVNDGSTDGTAAIIERLSKNYPLRALTHEHNKGFADTMYDGLVELAGASADDDFIATMDCDDTHDPQYLISAIDKMRGGYDVVLMSRFQEGGGESGLSFFRAFVSHCANRLMRVSFPIKGVKEYSCSYRLYRASAIKKALAIFGNDLMSLRKWGFVTTVEILIKLRMIGCKMAEVPFVLRYDRKISISRNSTIKSTMGYMLLVIRYSWKKIRLK